MSLRIRLVLLVLIAALPVLAVQVLHRLGERQAERQQIAVTALRLTDLQAERVARLVDTARALTTTLAQHPSVLERDGSVCTARIRDILERLPEFAGIGVFAPDGTSFCRSGEDRTIFIGDRSYFREVVRERRFVSSGHIFGRLVQQPAVIFAAPALDAGKLRAVVLLAYALSDLPKLLHEDMLPKGASIELVDAGGKLLAHLPASADARAGMPRGVFEPPPGSRSGTAVAEGADGIKRVYGYVALPEPASVEVVVGIPLAPALAEINALMWRDLAVITAIFALAALAALLMSEHSISRPMAALKTAAGRLARGDLAARARVGRAAAEEVSALAGSLNEMAEAIAARETALAASEELGRRILASSQDCIEVLDLDGRLLSINAAGQKALEIDDEAAVLGAFYGELWDEDVPGELHDALAQARGGEAARFLGRLHTASGREMWWDVSLSPIPDASGRPERLLVVSRDMTELKRAEQHRELLMAELDHRVKNALAAVQSMARQALAPGGQADVFVERFAALATAYGLLSNSRWEGGALTALLDGVLAAHRDRVTLSGPEVQLDARTTQVLALGVHELATNAAKHGALSRDTGRVEIRWTPGGGGRELRLEWLEHGGPAAEPPAATGFGLSLLRRSVRHELGGEVDLDFGPEGLRCRLLLPLRASSGRAETHDARRADAQRGGSADVPLPPSPGGRVLVLEDSVLVAMEIEAVLTEAGYAVLGPAATVAEAFQLMEARRTDAAVLDVNLGGGETSFPVATALRDQGTPFVFLTGYSNRAVFPPELLDAPRIAKPFQERRLLDTLAAALARPAAEAASGGA